MPYCYSLYQMCLGLLAIWVHHYNLVVSLQAILQLSPNQVAIEPTGYRLFEEMVYHYALNVCILASHTTNG